jgi:hypothetical protein
MADETVDKPDITSVAIDALRQIAREEAMVEDELGEVGIATKALAKIAGMRVEQSLKPNPTVHHFEAEPLIVQPPGLKT